MKGAAIAVEMMTDGDTQGKRKEGVERWGLFIERVVLAAAMKSMMSPCGSSCQVSLDLPPLFRNSQAPPKSFNMSNYVDPRTERVANNIVWGISSFHMPSGYHSDVTAVHRASGLLK